MNIDRYIDWLFNDTHLQILSCQNRQANTNPDLHKFVTINICNISCIIYVTIAKAL